MVAANPKSPREGSHSGGYGTAKDAPAPTAAVSYAPDWSALPADVVLHIATEADEEELYTWTPSGIDDLKKHGHNLYDKFGSPSAGDAVTTQNVNKMKSQNGLWDVMERTRGVALEEHSLVGDMATFDTLARADVLSVEPREFVHLLQQGHPCIDVRSFNDFEKGHIPGATSLELFTASERKDIAASLRQAGRVEASRLATTRITRRLGSMMEKIQDLVASTPEGTCTAAQADVSSSCSGRRRILVQCSGDGLRSALICWLLRSCLKLDVVLLRGGYKAFLAWCHNLYGYLEDKGWTHNSKVSAAECGTDLAAPSAAELEWRSKNPDGGGPRIAIVGGRTGCGKTKVLHALRHHFKEQVIDLEGLANHSGSAFGWCGHEPQPSTQQFGNKVALDWAGLDPNRWVFVEDEGPNIGSVSTPLGLYKRMRDAPVVLQLKVPMKARVGVLVEDYASEDIRSQEPDWLQRMVSATVSLQKRLGVQRAEELRALLNKEDYAGFAEALLCYYDKLYDNHIANAGGTGEGAGLRSGTMLEVYVDENCRQLDAIDVARQVLDGLASFEKGVADEKAS